MTPKSLLRHPLSVSRLEELAGGGFKTVIDEIDDLEASAVTRVVLCSGKVYFDLLKARRDAKIDAVAIVRLEQLYPFPSEEYEAILRKYANAREIVWCQEEPQNQGGWYQIRHRLQAPLGPKDELLYAGRAGAAAPGDRHLRAARAAAEESGHRGAAGRPAGRDLTTDDAPPDGGSN